MEKQHDQGAEKPGQAGTKPSSSKKTQKVAEGSQKEGKTKAELKAERRAKQVRNKLLIQMIDYC